MEKLLHERLRDETNQIDDSIFLVVDDKLIRANIDTAKALADEIEHNHIPIPRDKEGNPWKRDDECFGAFGEGFIGGYDGEGGVFVYFYSNDDEDGFYETWSIVRPTKVLDADGVPCRIGETVFRTEDCKRGRIKYFKFDENGEPILSCDSMQVQAKFVTHNARVLDEDSIEKVLADMMQDKHMRGTSYIPRIQLLTARDA